MKKLAKMICIALVLSVMMGFLTACPINAKNGSVSKKTLHYKVDWRLDNYGTAYPLSIYQYDKDKKLSYNFENNSNDGTLLTIYEDNTEYIIKPKYTKINWYYTDLGELAKQYDYKNDYFGKIDYEYSGDKVIRETHHYPNGSYAYRFNKLVFEYTRNKDGLVTRKIITGTDGPSNEPKSRDVYEYEYDSNGNITKMTLNGKYVDEYGHAGIKERRYDDHNNLILLVSQDGSSEEYKRTYDKKGLQTNLVITYRASDGSVSSESRTFEYDDHDNVVLEKGKMNDFTSETRHEYKYDEKGKMTYHRKYSTNSKGFTDESIWSHKFEYDADGDLIKDSDLQNKRNWTEYIYWGAEPDIKETRIDNSDPEEVTTETETEQTVNTTVNSSSEITTTEQTVTSKTTAQSLGKVDKVSSKASAFEKSAYHLKTLIGKDQNTVLNSIKKKYKVKLSKWWYMKYDHTDELGKQYNQDWIEYYYPCKIKIGSASFEALTIQCIASNKRVVQIGFMNGSYFDHGKNQKKKVAKKIYDYCKSNLTKMPGKTISSRDEENGGFIYHYLTYKTSDGYSIYTCYANWGNKDKFNSYFYCYNVNDGYHSESYNE